MFYSNSIQINNEINNIYSISSNNLELEEEPKTTTIIDNDKENILYTLENIKESDIKEVYKHRQSLVVKKLNNELTKEDETELKYLEWQIDRYEMAKYSADFSKLESIISSHKQAVNSILESVGIKYEK